MRKFLASLILSSIGGTLSAQSDSAMVSNIYNEALSNGKCYDQLHDLCKNVGNRLAGSENADKAIIWAFQTMQSLGFDSVFLMPVQVPHWIRGNVEYLKLEGKEGRLLQAVALGGSVGSDGIITANVIEVKNLEQLRNLSPDQVNGKIVFINKALDPVLINTGAAYSGAYDIRGKGPSEAAKMGAVACIIRSLTTAEDQYPHTGATHYLDSIPKIPAMAISSNDSRFLSALLKEKPDSKLTLELNCQLLPEKTQYNVIGEIRGSAFPNEYMIVGGHLDSWDIGEGAHDDGTGVVQSIEVLRTLKAIGYRPLHTLRCVLFINEEFGNDGGETYATVTKENGQPHLVAIESDGGGFSPKGFSCQSNDDKRFTQLKSFSPIFERYELFAFRQGWSGVDIGPLKNERNALFGLSVDTQRYFDYHHSANDRFENVNKRELTLGAAAMASLLFLMDQHWQ